MDVLMTKGILLGGIILSSIMAGLFFLRFWKVTGDRLFLFFSLAFFTMALSRVLMSLTVVSSDEHPVVYIVRLLAYGLILFGVLDKNRKKSHTSFPQNGLHILKNKY